MSASAVPAGIPGPSIAFPIQMQDVYLYEVRVTRTPEPIGPGGPTLEPSIVGHGVQPDGRTLTLLLKVVAKAEFRPEAFATIECTMMGVFVANAAIDPARAAAFSAREGIVLMWPYLRATMADLAARLQIPFPILPTLDVTQLLRILADQRKAPRDRSNVSKPRRPRNPAAAEKQRVQAASGESPRLTG